jgi:Ribosomal protein L4/L1 family
LSGRVLVVLGEEDGYADRSFSNLPDVQTIVAGELNAYDILVNDWVVFTEATLPGGSGTAIVDDSATDTPVSADADADADEPVADATEDVSSSDSAGDDSANDSTEEDSTEAEGAGT